MATDDINPGQTADAAESNFNRCKVCNTFHALGYCSAEVRPVSSDPAQAIIEDRENTHGDYAVQARLSQMQKALLRGSPGWKRLTPSQQETLDMVCVKMSRVLCGNQNEPDHWLDMMGYVKLVHNELTKGTSL